MNHLLLAVSADNNTLLWGAAMFVMLYVVIRPFIKRKRDPLETSSFPSLSQQRSVERQMSNLLVDLSAMARQITAQLDTRAAKLEVLIRQADQRLAALAQATGQPLAPPLAAPATEQTQPLPAPPQPAAATPDTRHSEVYALADQGLSCQQIAHQLDRPQGEIELILALRIQ